MRAQCFIARTILSDLQKSIIFKNYNLITQEEMIHADKEQTGSSPYGGELIIAMDPERFLGADDKEEHLARAEGLFNDMAAQGARIPGARRVKARQHSEQFADAI